MRNTTLFVAGISARTRAKDLAYEFERYGRLVRCDIPAPRTSSSKAYAFVEFEDPRDAEDAYHEMQGRRFEGYPLTIQWAKNAPSRSWRYDSGRGNSRSRSPPRRGGRSRSPRRPRSPSPPRKERSPRGRSRSPRREADSDERRVDDVKTGDVPGHAEDVEMKDRNGASNHDDRNGASERRDDRSPERNGGRDEDDDRSRDGSD